MPEKLPVLVVIVNFNTRDLLRRALTAIYVAKTLPAKVFVVDNNSTDGSQAMVKQEFPLVSLVESKKNLGFAGGNNLAISQSAGESYIWLLNSDTEVGPETLRQLYEYMENHPQVGGVVPQLVYPDRSFQSVGGWFPSISNVFCQLFPIQKIFPLAWRKNLKLIANIPSQISSQGLDLDYGTGAALFLRKIALDQVGLLGEEYFMYFEETDLCWRLKGKNWSIKAIATDPVMHIYGGSFKAQHDQKRLKYFWQSLEIFVKKNYHGFVKTVIIGEIKLFSKLSTWLKGI